MGGVWVPGWTASHLAGKNHGTPGIKSKGSVSYGAGCLFSLSFPFLRITTHSHAYSAVTTESGRAGWQFVPSAESVTWQMAGEISGRVTKVGVSTGLPGQIYCLEAARAGPLGWLQPGYLGGLPLGGAFGYFPFW